MAHPMRFPPRAAMRHTFSAVAAGPSLFQASGRWTKDCRLRDRCWSQRLKGEAGLSDVSVGLDGSRCPAISRVVQFGVTVKGLDNQSECIYGRGGVFGVH